MIVVENLNVKGIMHSSKLAKSIHQLGWGMFCAMLKYKAEVEGKIYQEVSKSAQIIITGLLKYVLLIFVE
ncbi:MAG: IS200/IS605 family accessory protein TnpB-related protein [Nostoc sp.]|uniref:IS200/IS605 family accessory protein TnpB-related protein n=1 Tax=Nostoc sp. TaxID=1180 RepID=UPI002FF82C16